MEASELLGSFDGRLREYAARKLQKQGVTLIKVNSLDINVNLATVNALAGKGGVNMRKQA